MTNHCSFKQVRKCFSGREVLSVPEIEFHPGTTCLVLGGNGAGKSTLLRLAAQITKPTQGAVTWASPTSPTNRAYLGSQLGLYAWLTARETLALQSSLKKEGAKPEEVLEQWGISRFADKPIKELSQGQKVKVALARALAFKPSLTFLDEPTSHLDNAAVDLLFKNIELHGKEQITLIASHDLERCLPYATRLLLLHEGLIVEDSYTLGNVSDCGVKRIVARYAELNR
jgi:ABC-type multidrug transport system ATPase subunit